MEKNKAKGFRFNGKNVGLTFPQCDITLEEFKNALLLWTVPVNGYTKFAMGRELHEDGKHHFHVYLHYPKKLNLKRADSWDIYDSKTDKWYHPNITRFSNRSTQDQIDKWISYCKKEGEWVQEGFLSKLFTFIHWKDYAKKKKDLQLWEQDSKDHQRVKAFPFALPNEVKIYKPDKDENGKFRKRRHWLLLGPPDCGKTYWMNKEFKGKRVHVRPKNDKYGGPFERECYDGEDVVIYDDVVPKLEELIDVGNVFEIKTQTYGGQRYGNNYWPLGQARVMVWLLNPDNLPEYAMRGAPRYDIFKARFNFLQWDVEGMEANEEGEFDPVYAWRVLADSPKEWIPPSSGKH